MRFVFGNLVHARLCQWVFKSPNLISLIQFLESFHQSFPLYDTVILIHFPYRRRALSATKQCDLPLMVHHSFSTVPLGSDGEWTLVKILTINI